MHALSRLIFSADHGIVWRRVLVCLALFCQVGCQSPFRFWKGARDEPNIEQFLNDGDKWDAARKQSNSDRRVAQPPMSARKSPAQLREEEAKIEAARNLLESKDAKPSAAFAEEEDPENVDAEYESALASAPPHLRTLLKRQWEAIRGSKQKTGESTAEEQFEEVDQAPIGKSLTRRAVPAQEGSQRTARTTQAEQEMPAASDHQPVRMSFKDETEEFTDDAVTAKSHELPKPPAKNRTKSPVASNPIETDTQDDALLVPPARNATRPRDQLAGTREGERSPDPAVTPAAAEVHRERVADTVAPAVDVRGKAPVDAASVVSPDASATSSSNAPQLDWRGHAREAARLLAEEAKAESAQSPAQKLSLNHNRRLMHLSLGELDKALEPIEGLQPHEQDFFRDQYTALHNATDPSGNPVLSRRWTLALENDRKALAHLSAVSNLEVRNASFCTEVESYGVVSKFAGAHFRPNQELLLYCELDNFAAEPVKDGFETQLQGSYEIVDGSGRRVADQLLPVDSHVCRNQRRDYFIAYRIYMPQQISPGRYQLKLTIEDMKGRKFGQTTLDFQIVP